MGIVRSVETPDDGEIGEIGHEFGLGSFNGGVEGEVIDVKPISRDHEIDGTFESIIGDAREVAFVILDHAHREGIEELVAHRGKRGEVGESFEGREGFRGGFA